MSSLRSSWLGLFNGRITKALGWSKSALTLAPHTQPMGLTKLLASPFFFPILWITVGVLALCGAGMAYGLEVWGKFPACRLCHIERILLALAGIGSTFFGLYGYPSIFLGVSALWLGLAGTSFYHMGVQFKWWAMPKVCQLNWAPTLDAFMAQPSARCDQRTLEIFGLPASLWLCVGTLVALILVAWTWGIKPWRK